MGCTMYNLFEHSENQQETALGKPVACHAKADMLRLTRFFLR